MIRVVHLLTFPIMKWHYISHLQKKPCWYLKQIQMHQSIYKRVKFPSLILSENIGYCFSFFIRLQTSASVSKFSTKENFEHYLRVCNPRFCNFEVWIHAKSKFRLRMQRWKFS